PSALPPAPGESPGSASGTPNSRNVGRVRRGTHAPGRAGKRDDRSSGNPPSSPLAATATEASRHRRTADLDMNNVDAFVSLPSHQASSPGLHLGLAEQGKLYALQ